MQISTYRYKASESGRVRCTDLHPFQTVMLPVCTVRLITRGVTMVMCVVAEIRQQWTEKARSIDGKQTGKKERD